MKKFLLSLLTISGVVALCGVARAHHGRLPIPNPSDRPTWSAIPTPSAGPTPIPGFSNANFTGTYSDVFEGTVDGIGVVTADGNNNITGSETFSDGINVCNGSVSGTYSINSNGTGTILLSFTTATTIAGTCPSTALSQTLALVITFDGDISTIEEDPGLLVRGHLTRQIPLPPIIQPFDQK
jgi:hypothetical protein